MPTEGIGSNRSTARCVEKQIEESRGERGGVELRQRFEGCNHCQALALCPVGLRAAEECAEMRQSDWACGGSQGWRSRLGG